MSTVTERRIPPALLLNADYRPLAHFPLSTLSWQDAVRAIYQRKVDVVETYDTMIHGPSLSMRAPAVVALRNYIAASDAPALFSRFNLRLRDRFACCYCDSREDLTFDHVVPKSKGGRTQYENIVTACIACNQRKMDKSVKAAGMTLRHLPWAPTIRELIEIGRTFLPPNVVEEWKDYLYWTVPLDSD